ncbi:phosphogluconate dehydrogenase C-terminal domain-containing protein [Nocardiopsis sp. MG754419]|uniref:phosphogluconate dehydrogenase C-terminal domain-containing protein n=1 Tax=Nocardiopsis sp. MG754419 TaxID=2259865 RepID=UPI001BA8A5D6|nr:phosphogluconate dehydrogenase C-terminal domain-containing protein [Nocardiopsis sp. MG754419]MBR8743363.1 oxidoreductase [Nocardiopsis sp. MG754419]
MSIDTLTIAVVGAGGKMGQRVSNNLKRTDATVRYAENSPAGRERVEGLGLEVTPTAEAVTGADVVILAVPDIVLGAVSEEVVPLLDHGSIVVTLDPAAAYAGLLHQREGIEYVCAHPAHPSIFLQRTTKEEYADTFGGVAAPQHAVAAVESGKEDVRAIAETVIRTMYAPVIDVHWVSVKQLAILEPTLVETIACMIGELLHEALEETVNTAGVPRAAAEALFHGHIQVALVNALRGDHPFSDACHIAMGHGRELIVKDDWKRVFDDAVLDETITKMLKIDAIKR